MKLVELGMFDEKDPELGIQLISIVDNPAIETNFYYFGFDIAGLSPYVDQRERVKRKRRERRETMESLLVKPVEEWQEDEVVAFAYLQLVEKNEIPIEMEILYAYEGPGPERTFCDRYWQREFSLFDIVNAMEFDDAALGFGPDGSDYYDKFLYKGGPNCKHFWSPSSVREIYRSGKDKNVKYERNRHLDTLLKELSDWYDNPEEAFRTALTPMEDMPNHGYLTKDKGSTKLSYAFLSEDQHTIVSPVMIPDKRIIRQDEKTKELYQVFFSKETIRKMSEKYMRELKIHEATEMHDMKKPVEWAMLESWIVEDPEHDKSKLYGFDLPAGTWMASFRILDEEVWKKVKDGTFRGISLEGKFQENVVKD